MAMFAPPALALHDRRWSAGSLETGRRAAATAPGTGSIHDRRRRVPRRLQSRAWLSQRGDLDRDDPCSKGSGATRSRSIPGATGAGSRRARLAVAPCPPRWAGPGAGHDAAGVVAAAALLGTRAPRPAHRAGVLHLSAVARAVDHVYGEVGRASCRE